MCGGQPLHLWAGGGVLRKLLHGSGGVILTQQVEMQQVADGRVWLIEQMGDYLAWHRH